MTMTDRLEVVKMKSTDCMKTLVALGVGLTLHVAQGSAQTIRGRIVDAETGEPVTLAYVELLEADRDPVTAGVAGVDGAFSVRAPSSGSFLLYVRRDGYETLTDGLFELGPGSIAEVRVGLTPEPIELDALTVEAERDITRLEASGFYDRVLTAPGYFLSREDIERVGSSRTADVFQRIPRVEVDATRPLTGPDVMQYPAILMRMGADFCSPTLYVDRHVVANGVSGPVRPDDYVSTSEIEAIEVYARAAQAPVDFDPINDCGVVLIWTRLR
jgi:hypothetical protein